MAIDGNHSSGAAYFRFAEEMDPEMVQVQVDNGKAKGLDSIKNWIATNWRAILGIIIAILLLAIGILIGHTIVGHPIRTVGVDHCKTNNTARPPERPQLNVTQLFQAYVKQDKLKEYFKKFTSGPHYAGSKGNLELASYIAERWTFYGFEVTNKTYRVTLSRPNGPNRIEVFDQATGELQPNMVVEPEINDFVLPAAGMLPPFNPYSGNNASLEGDPFYVNFGRIEDFAFIRDQMHTTKTVKGNICVARMGVIPLSRLVENCKNEGAIAVLAFPDESLYAQAGDKSEDVYPKTWWLPLNGTVRDSARSTYGDPASFFYPSFEDLPSSGAYNGATIPVQVISYDDADGILRAMKNPPAPPVFHANSSVHKWFMGPGIHSTNNKNVLLRMVVNVTSTSEKITNVIGIMRGSVEPDRYVIVGNHRDSLTYGGVEPGTGSACLMELSRVLGQLYDQGWRPRRTIILASWDAGEDGHIGSTEWVEEHLEILHERAVAYINLDEAVSGQHTFTAEGSPLLAEVLYQATQKIDCPDPDHTSMLIYNNWSNKQPISATNKKPMLSPPGTTSDLTPFLHLAGVPSVDLRYTYDENFGRVPVPTYPLMHTAFDDADYVMKKIDADFLIHAAVTKVVGEVILELADATLLPVKVGHYADSLERYADGLSDLYLDSNSVDLESLKAATKEFSQAAGVFQHEVDVANVSMPLELRDINDRLMAVERAFLGHGGMTLQEQQLRHVIYGPSVSHMYKGVPFPMLTNHLVIGNVTQDFTEVRKHLPHMATMIRVAAKVLDNTDTV